MMRMMKKDENEETLYKHDETSLHMMKNDKI